MTDRRAFLRRAATAAGALALSPAALLAGAADVVGDELARLGPAAAPARLAEDEAFWARVRAGYALDPQVLNLDHGWTNPTPRAALDELARQARVLEGLPAEHLPGMWEGVSNVRVRGELAAAMGVPPAEIALVRNATEALDTVLLGLPLQRGDEVVCATHDYYAMLDALEQRRDRDGIVLRMVELPVPAPSLDALAERYEAAIGPRTKLVLLTHPSNLTGQLLPAARIAAAARRAGALVAVDGAQSLGVLEDPVRSLDCDFYGASAHKWLGLPVGLGVLWMRPAHVERVWPLLPPAPGTKGMARFEWIGTAPEYVNLAALPALALHRTLGPARKAARLRYLADRWRARAARALPQARYYAEPAQSLGLTTVEIPGTDAKALQQRLRRRDRILVQAMVDNARAPGIRGLRVSPNVYTTPAELDRFVDALAAAARAS
ncbi:aminotransferase class V-fold PLP-dependent enzyme [Roseisolibacter sp. H3M3-2]|uniref:aminotransferase class V-fold PLP-dependent enzyme n=1 Tax=Roseisolibacter sp. H3M3-2 TaxID=3031323 RepID=UPI0023DC2819|nr:aminotransferase class V-fold PLP-dependent enzyme [Roseisolibacter sp. H3M3-2]MDF1504382.1 aminotransferase class V-fold PLP-dependent enzyme [Roseisolibacter sp. H3M3-2]